MSDHVADTFLTTLHNLGHENEPSWKGLREELATTTEDELVVLLGKTASLYDIIERALKTKRT